MNLWLRLGLLWMTTLFQNLDSPAFEVTDWVLCCSGNFLFYQNLSAEKKETIVYPDHGSFFSAFEIRQWSSFFWTYSAIAHFLKMFLAVAAIVSDCESNAVSPSAICSLVASESDLSCVETSPYLLFFGHVLLLSPLNHS